MKYTTLPMKPGRYIDRAGDAWTLKENSGWECKLLYNGGSRTEAEKWLPFTDAPDDDKPTSTDDKMQRIDNVDDLKPGDLVHFHDDPRGYPFLFRLGGNYIHVALQWSGAPLWLCNALANDVMVDIEYFDHAERPKPSWPEPEGLTPRLYLGADGKRYKYTPDGKYDASPWMYQVGYKNFWQSAEWLATNRPEALPLREFTAPEEQA